MNSRTTLTWHTAPGEYFWFNPTSLRRVHAIRLVKPLESGKREALT